MKKILLTMAAMTVCGMATAQTAEDTVYVFKEDQPNFLQAPPDTASLEFVDDMIQWVCGKRSTPGYLQFLSLHFVPLPFSLYIDLIILYRLFHIDHINSDQ